MKIRLAAVLVGALVAVAMGEVPSLEHQTWALTTIDLVPTKAQLDRVLMDNPTKTPAQTLIDYAQGGSDGSADVGIRLRAIAALSNYGAEPEPVHTTLIDLINQYASARSGSDLLILRAAIEADGPLTQTDDLDLTFRNLRLLDHPSRDIRAATARALASLRNCHATEDLHSRYQNESSDQVKLAISEALRILSQPSNCLVN